MDEAGVTFLGEYNNEKPVSLDLARRLRQAKTRKRSCASASPGGAACYRSFLSDPRVASVPVLRAFEVALPNAAARRLCFALSDRVTTIVNREVDCSLHAPSLRQYPGHCARSRQRACGCSGRGRAASTRRRLVRPALQDALPVAAGLSQLRRVNADKGEGQPHARRPSHQSQRQ